MRFRLLSRLQVVDFSEGGWKYRELPPGEYEVKEVDNPVSAVFDTWLVLEGTQMGAPKGVWKHKSHIKCRSRRRQALTVGLAV